MSFICIGLLQGWVVTEKGIDCRSEDVGRENVSVSRLGEGYLQTVSVIC